MWLSPFSALRITIYTLKRRKYSNMMAVRKWVRNCEILSPKLCEWHWEIKHLRRQRWDVEFYNSHFATGRRIETDTLEQGFQTTQWGVHSVGTFCTAFLTCSTVGPILRLLCSATSERNQTKTLWLSVRPTMYSKYFEFVIMIVFKQYLWNFLMLNPCSQVS